MKCPKQYKVTQHNFKKTITDTEGGIARRLLLIYRKPRVQRVLQRRMCRLG